MAALVMDKMMDVWEPAHAASFIGPEKDIRESKGPLDEMRQLCRATSVG